LVMRSPERTLPMARTPAPPIAVKPITAAEMLDCTRAHIYKMMERGALRRIDLPDSRAVRIPIEDIYAAIGIDAGLGMSGDKIAAFIAYKNVPVQN